MLKQNLLKITQALDYLPPHKKVTIFDYAKLTLSTLHLLTRIA